MISDEDDQGGWRIVLAALAGITLGLAPIPFYTLGLFAPYLRAAFGWSQGTIMAGLSAMTLTSIVAAPIVGLLVNRVGARRIAIGSLLLFGPGLMLLALSNGSLWRWFGSWVLLSLAGAGTLPITWTRIITAAFVRRRGLALGLALMGTGLFGFFGKPLTAALIGHVGWRGAFVGLGLLPVVIAAPLAWGLLRNTQPARAHASPAGAGDDWRACLGAWRLWLIVAALVPISFALTGPLPNMEAILRGQGLADGVVRGITPFIGLAALVGRLGGGWLLDRFWAPGVAFVMLCLPAAALSALAHGGIDARGACAAVILIGLAIGVEYDIVAYLVARYFPVSAYAPLYAITYTAFLVGAGGAPMIFGWSFDRTGSFAPALEASIVGLLAGAAALLLLGRYRDAAAPAVRQV